MKAAPPQKHDKALSLKNNFVWNLTGNVVYAGCQWGMIIILAKATNAEIVGQFALGVAVTAPIFLLSQLQLRGIQATDAKNEYDFRHYLSLRTITTLIALAITISVAFFGYDIHTASIVLAISLSKVFDSISDVFFGLMQKHQRMDKIAISRMTKGPLSLVALGVVVFLTQKLLWGVLAMTTVWGFVLFAFDIPNGRRILLMHSNQNTTQNFTPNFHLNRIWHLALLALPLGFVMALASLKTNIPRYFIEHHLSMPELGQFVSLYSLVILGSTIMQAMAQAFTPRYAVYYHSGNRRGFIKLLLLIMGAGTTLGVGLLITFHFMGDQLIRLLYGDEYINHSLLLLILIAGSIQYIFSLGGAITALRYIKVQVPFELISTTAILIACTLLMPSHGLNGAAYSIIIGAITRALLISLTLGYALLYRFDSPVNTSSGKT